MTSKRHIYLTGALAARDSLRRTQSNLHTISNTSRSHCAGRWSLQPHRSRLSFWRALSMPSGRSC